jgi:hypothetical protein
MIKDGHKENQEKTGRKYGRKGSAKVEKATGECNRGTLRTLGKEADQTQASHSDRARSRPAGGGKVPPKEPSEHKTKEARS